MPSSIQVTQRLLALIGDDTSSDEQIQQAARALLQSTKGTSAGNLNNVLEALCLGLDVEDPARASIVMLVCGSLVEFGAKTAPLHEPLVEQFRKLVERSKAFHDAVLADMATSDAEDFDRQTAFETAANSVAAVSPKAAASWKAFEQSYMAGIALFSVSRDARALARRELATVRELAEDHVGAGWLWKMLQVLDDEPLLVIEPATRLGIVGRMNGVAENFQLNVLLMDVFPQRSWFSRRRVSRQAAEVARGNGPQQTDEWIQGAWNLHTFAALQADKTLLDPKDFAAGTHWVWNEGVPADIPVFAGHRVVLLGPASYARGWGSQRAFNLLPASISQVRKLSKSEVETWLDRICGNQDT